MSLGSFDRYEALMRTRAELRYKQGRLQGGSLARSKGVRDTGIILLLVSWGPWWAKIASGVIILGVGLWMLHDCKTWVEPMPELKELE